LLRLLIDHTHGTRACNRSGLLLTQADSGGATTRSAATAAKAFGIAAYGCDFALFFAQHLIESTDRFFEFTPEALGAFCIRLGGELPRTACTASACSITIPAGTAAFHASLRFARGTALSTGCSAGFAAAFEFGRFAGTATAQAFTSLAHAADATWQRTGISALAAAFTVTVAIAAAVAIASFSRLATLTICTVTTAHAREAARRREFHLGHTAHATRLATARGTTAGRRAATRRSTALGAAGRTAALGATLRTTTLGAAGGSTRRTTGRTALGAAL
jgi:hypothetical protein